VVADGVWVPERRALTFGLTLTISLVALESLAIATVLPRVSEDLGGVALYGWVFSAFFLGTMVGIVVAGQSADRLGAAPAFTLGLSLFALGLLAGGLAPNMLVLVLARAVQGFGAGAVPAIGYVAIGRSYPDALRPRMFAVLSSAWVIPGILGPSLASLVEHAFGWRFVFAGLLPFVLAAGVLTLPALRTIGPGQVDEVHGPDRSRLPDALRVAGGAAAVLAGLGNRNLLILVPLVVVGTAVAWPSYLRLVPAGTLRARPGLPAAVLARGVLTFAFFGADVYVPLALHDVRGMSTLWIGVSVTLTTLTWTAGAWLQERAVVRAGARRLVIIGHALILGGILLTALALWRQVPVAVAFVGWSVGGLGIGLSYAPISLVVLREAAPGREGAATAALQLTDQLGVSLGTGLGGAAVALGEAGGWDPASGIAMAWGLAAVVAAAGMVVGRRLPGPVGQPEPVPAA
jgi:MFS family permease